MKAVELDPNFGLAWAVLADNYVSAWIQNPKYEPLQHEHQNPETLEKALDAARRATLVAPNLADGHAKIGWVLHWMRQPEEAQNAYRTAFEINPNLIRRCLSERAHQVRSPRRCGSISVAPHPA